MNCHSLHPYVLEGPVLGIHGHLLHQFKCSTELCTINHLAKDSVFAVEMRLLAVGDENCGRIESMLKFSPRLLT